MDALGPAFSVWDEVYGSYVSHTLHPASLNTNWRGGVLCLFRNITELLREGGICLMRNCESIK